jgi:hypothetical protein
MSRDLFDGDCLKHDRMGTLLGDGVIEDRVPFEDMPFDLDTALWFRMVVPLIMKG